MTYPSLDDGNKGEVIQLGYGDINKQPAICTNEADEVTTTYNFKITDTTYHTIQSIDKVYVEGVEVAFSGASTTDGTFNLSNTVYESGQEVSASYNGYAITNPLDIIEDILFIFANISYSTDTFNTTEWEAVKLLMPDINLAVTESTKIIDIIGEISTTVQGLFLIQGDGKITFKLRDPNKDSVATIKILDQMAPPVQTNPSEEYTSSIRVGYKRAWSTGKHSYIVDSSDEETLFEKYRTRKERTFKTLLTNSTDAGDFADNIYDQFGGIYPTFKFQTKLQFLGLQLEDNIDAEVYILNDGEYGKVKLEVIGLDVNYTTGTMTITGRFIEYVDAILDVAALVKWKPGQGYVSGAIAGSAGSLWRALLPSTGQQPEISATFWEEYIYTANDTSIGPLKYNGFTKLDGALYGGTTDPTNNTRLNYDGDFYATRVYNAVYNDFSEKFESDEEELPGRVYVTKSDGMIGLSRKRADKSVIGVCSDRYAFIIRSTLDGGIPIGLAGTLEVETASKVKPGDYLVSYIDGLATKANMFDIIFNHGAILGKVLKYDKFSKKAFFKII